MAAETFTGNEVGAAAGPASGSEYVTLTVCAPAVFQVTVTELVLCPAVIDPPADTVHV